MDSALKRKDLCCLASSLQPSIVLFITNLTIHWQELNADLLAQVHVRRTIPIAVDILDVHMILILFKLRGVLGLSAFYIHGVFQPYRQIVAQLPRDLLQSQYDLGKWHFPHFAISV